MIRQTRSAIRFLLADYRAVLKFALLASVGTGAVEEHNGFRNMAAASMGQVQGHDTALWVTHLYKRSSSDSFDIEGSRYGANSNLYGLALGADFAVSEGFMIGADFNIGKGYSKSRGDIDYTKNDYNFIGLGLYGSSPYDKLNVPADLGYTMIDNDIDQDGSRAFESDIDSKVLSLGVNAKYELNTSFADIAPYAGVRYFRTMIDSYNIKNNGTKCLHGKSIAGNLVGFTVGLTSSREFIRGRMSTDPVTSRRAG